MMTAVKFSLGMVVMILQINVLGKYDFSLNTPINQVQNYVLGGIIGGVIYNSSITVLQFMIVILIWSLVVILVKLVAETSRTFRKFISCQPELLICKGEVDVSRCAKVGLTAEQLSRCLREENISCVADVDAAVMETNGKLTIRSRETRSDSPLLPLVSDGHLVEDGLRLSGKDTAWVEAKVKEQGYSSIKDVFLGQLCDGALEIVPFPRARIKAPMSGDM